MTETPSVLAPLLLGFALGIRHALDPDHLAAMGTIVARERSPGRAAILGSVWGLGHSTSLLLASLVIIAWRIPVPAGVTHYLELGVAAMLIVLGVQSLVRPAPADEPRGAPRRRRPYLIGLVHGLAGSGGLALVVLPTLPDRLTTLVYVALFGIGSIGGMALWSAALSAPLGRLSRPGSRAKRWVPTISGIVSVGCGIVLAAQVA
ncbi:MAG: hypothetical protein AABZ94_06160 [Candidatus Eisenbacteria bacterium]